MANQQELSDFIKKVHIDLRMSSRKVGAESAWKEHCKKNSVLKKYAETMHDLATLYWDKNQNDVKNINRILWVVKQCEKYFSREQREEMLEKEQRLALHYFGDVVESKSEVFQENQTLKLLDVGSCYNPFNNFERFEVTAIDLAPAKQDVLRCDFLEVRVEDKLLVEEGEVKSLPRHHFDVVVLSLLLEYLPHPSFRYSCCLKTYELLYPGGVLMIVTPDSKHPSANSQIIKNWRMALADIGFMKATYEKTEHLHCMSYRKCLDRRIPRKWLSLKHNLENDPKDMMVIPQDNVQYKSGNDDGNIQEQRCDSDNKEISDCFSILAGEFLF